MHIVTEKSKNICEMYKIPSRFLKVRNQPVGGGATPERKGRVGGSIVENQTCGRKQHLK